MDDKLIKTAIRSKNLLKFNYHGHVRVIEPHCYGLSTNGNPVLRAFQVGGTSPSGPLSWRLFSMEDVKKVEFLNETFLRARPDYNANDSGMTKIFCAL